MSPVVTNLEQGTDTAWDGETIRPTIPFHVIPALLLWRSRRLRRGGRRVGRHGVGRRLRRRGDRRCCVGGGGSGVRGVRGGRRSGVGRGAAVGRRRYRGLGRRLRWPF